MERYVLITPARNEANFIGYTLEAVTMQTVKPLLWVIVSDNSDDGTDELVQGYSSKHSYVRLVRINNKEERNFGAQVRAFLRGYEKVKNLEYDYIGNLDADVSFEKSYFEKVLLQFSKNPKLGLAGGYIYEFRKDSFKARNSNALYSVAHAVQLFRKECYTDIGGYTPLLYGGSDSLAEIRARMYGWNVQAFPWLEVKHHKPTLGAEGLCKGAFRQGLMDYSLGNNHIYSIGRCLIRSRFGLNAKYAFCRYLGFFWASIKRNPREVTKDFMNFYRNEQRSIFFSALKNCFRRRSISIPTSTKAHQNESVLFKGNNV